MANNYVFDSFILTPNGLELNIKEILLHSELNAVFKRDNTKDKFKAFKEFSYMFHIVNPKSELVQKGYKGEELHNRAVKIARLEPTYVVDEVMAAAIDVYSSLINGVQTLAYASMLKTFNTSNLIIDSLTEALEKQFILNKNKADGKLSEVNDAISSLQAIMTMASKLPELIDKLNTSKDLAATEILHKRVGRADIPITHSMMPK